MGCVPGTPIPAALQVQVEVPAQAHRLQPGKAVLLIFSMVRALCTARILLCAT